MNLFSEKVYNLCKQIPKGKVTTYKEIARALEVKSYQAIGQILKRNPNPKDVPCFKVVKSNGKIGGYCGSEIGKIKIKVKKLEEEGIIIKDGKINLKEYLFSFG